MRNLQYFIETNKTYIQW